MTNSSNEELQFSHLRQLPGPHIDPPSSRPFDEREAGILPPDDVQEAGILPTAVSQSVHPPIEEPPKEAIPPAIDANSDTNMFQFSTPRIFLDLCSGVSNPLSQALQSFNCDTFAFDILIHEHYDLLRDDTYERLLRICACGLVAYSAAAPACKEYSRLKLRSGGPKALRTPSHMQGVPGLNSSELQRVQESSTILERCVTCLRVTFQAGGHSHLEQPASAMSWEEPFVQQFLVECQCSCINLAACKFGENWLKSWMFAATFSELQSLACVCDHHPDSHIRIAGHVDASGQYLSRITATYPHQLCIKFAEIIHPLISKGQRNWDMSAWENQIPQKSLQDLPHARNDGGGLSSHADWSHSNSSEDFFGTLRKNWMNHIIQTGLDKKLVAHFQQVKDEPPFSEEELSPLRNFLVEFLESQGHPANWDIPADQPMHLHIIHSLCQIMEDRDKTLFAYLHQGVPVGIDEAISRSNCFPIAKPKNPDDNPLLSVHHCNWQSAEDNPEDVSTLIQKEIDEQWVEEFHGTLEDAQARWPKGVAVGKLGLALSDSRPPRLVLDSTICGVNGRCVIPEHATLPSAQDVKRCYPLRNNASPLSGFSLDIRSAHKRIAVKEQDRGFLLFKFQGRYFYYKVCPFGAVFSAHYWARLGGAFLRLFHMLCFLAHAGFLFVDDLLMMQAAQMMPISASMICALAIISKIPVSWKKCELNHTLIWTGWKFHFQIGIVTIPDSKRTKLLGLCRKLLTSSKCSRKTLEQFLGLAMWITQLFKSMRTWLYSFYHDLHSIPASHYSIDPSNWHHFTRCLDNQLIFISKPTGTAIPAGSKLIQVRHQTIQSLSDLVSCPTTDRRIWIRLRDPGSSKRKLSTHSQKALKMFEQWLQYLSPVISMWPKPQWHGLCVADAFAANDKAGIGGAVHFPSGLCKWFSIPLCSADFTALNIPMHDNLQKDISSLETLAQIALIFMTTRFQPGFRIPIRIPTLSDNSAAESVSNSLFTTTMPLALFTEKLSMLISSTGIEVDTSHIAGEHNDLADKLSRWDGTDNPPCHMLCQDRVQFTLDQLWSINPGPQLFPSNAWIPWTLPSP